MSEKIAIETPYGYPDTYISPRPGWLECAVCGQDFPRPKSSRYEWHAILYCSKGCYMRGCAKAPPPPRKILKIIIPIDRLPDVRLPCSQCYEIFVPGPGSFWIQAEEALRGNVLPVCSEECKDGYQVREALAAEAAIEGRQASGYIIDDPVNMTSVTSADVARWAGKVTKT